MKCGRCGRTSHYQNDCYAKLHIDGSVIHSPPAASSPSAIRYEAKKKAFKAQRLVVKENMKHKAAVWGHEAYNTPPPSYSTKKRVWYYRLHKYMKKPDGTWAIVGENPYW